MNRWIRNCYLLCGIVIAVVVAGNSFAIAENRYLSTTPTIGPAEPGDCPSVQVTEEEIQPEFHGSPISVSVNGPATLRSFSGLSVTQIVPPTGWDPRSATDPELVFYGFPPRPTNVDQLSDWNAEWSNWSPVLSTPCPAGAGSLTFSKAGANWAGVEDTGQTNFDHVYAKVQLTTGSTGTCASANSYSAWVGLGGEGNVGLLQNGIGAGTTMPVDARGPGGDVAAWYEEISPSNKKSPVYLKPGFISPGDQISIWTTWLGSGEVSFSWHDLTTGHEVSFEDGGLTGGFYNGATAEYIDEDRSSQGEDVRHYGPLDWTGARAEAGSTTQYAGDWSHTDFYSQGGVTGTKTQDLTNGAMTNSSSFTMNWHACD